ncbi:unnamed protein product [Parnassius apollo]|uniref:(apollo) hypothetical protein n=1 Tax=Parnassius apollo TaxID=110799 RepID=A0A8S3YAJ9_PARAO|nr:unnamed protein product [Parnassius apollo]
MVIPRIHLSIRYILSELEEIEREDNFRLKRFKELKSKKVKKYLNLKDGTYKHEERLASIHDEIVGDYCCCLSYDDLRKVYKKNLSDEKICQASNKTSYQYEDDIILQTEKLINIPKQNENDLFCEDNFLSTCLDLKTILENILKNSVCVKCKKNIKMSSKLSVSGSILNINSETGGKLGYYERKYEEIIKVLRLQKEDGLISQEKQIITVKTDKRNPIRSQVFDHNNKGNNKILNSCQNRDDDKLNKKGAYKCNCENHDKNFINNNNTYCGLGNTKSEPVCGTQKWNEPQLWPCNSAANIKTTVVLEEASSTFPGDVTLNLIFKNESCEKIRDINVTKLPHTSSIKIHICNLPKRHVFKESQNDITSFNGLSLTRQEMLNKASCKISSQVVKAGKDVDTYTSDILKTSQMINHSSQALNQEEYMRYARVYTKFKDDCTYVEGLPHICNKIMTLHNRKRSDKDRAQSNCIHKKFPYIFSKVKKKSYRKALNTEECSEVRDTDGLVNKSFTKVTPFSYIFSSLRSNTIDDMLNHACSYTPRFSYVLSKAREKSFSTNDKSREIDAMFNDACKRTFNFTYIFSHLKDVEIDRKFKRSCMHKENFPYIFSRVKDKTNNQFGIVNRYKADEIETLFKNACKRPSDFPYIINHLNRIAIDGMIRKACSYTPDYPYIFSKVSSVKSTKDLYENNISYSIEMDGIFNGAKTNGFDNETVHKDKKLERNKQENTISPLKSINNIETETVIKDAWVSENDFNYLFDKREHNYLTELSDRGNNLGLNEIKQLFKDSCKRDTKTKCEFNYIFQNVFKDKNRQYKKCDSKSEKEAKAKNHSTVNCTNFMKEEVHSQNVSSEPDCSYTSNRTPNKLLLEIPSSKSSRDHIGIEIMWKTGCLCGNNLTSKSLVIIKSQRSSTNYIANIKKNVTGTKSWCSNKIIPKEHNSKISAKKQKEAVNLSLIHRMLDSIKNIYVPFNKPVNPEVNKKFSDISSDKLNSYTSISTISNYSWKSSVMKMCQADVECEENHISYSDILSTPSLDLLTCKSKAVGSNLDSIGSLNENISSCEILNTSIATETQNISDIEMNSDTLIKETDKRNSSNTAFKFCK